MDTTLEALTAELIAALAKGASTAQVVTEIGESVTELRKSAEHDAVYAVA